MIEENVIGYWRGVGTIYKRDSKIYRNEIKNTQKKCF